MTPEIYLENVKRLREKIICALESEQFDGCINSHEAIPALVGILGPLIHVHCKEGHLDVNERLENKVLPYLSDPEKWPVGFIKVVQKQ